MTLQPGVSNLEALLESAKLLHASLDLDDLLRHLLRTVMGRLVVAKGLIAVEQDGVQRLALLRGFPRLGLGREFDAVTAREEGASIILPIGDDSHPVGYLGIGKPAKGDVSDTEIEFLNALLGLAASGIENARAHAETRQLNQALDQKVQELRALLDLVRGLTSAIEPSEIAQLLGLTISGRWAVRKYAVAAWKDGHAGVVRQRGMEIGDPLDFREALDSLPEAQFVESLEDGPFKERLIQQQAKVVFPIRSNDSNSGGIVVLGSRPGALTFSDSDFDFGAGLVAQAAVAFDNSWFIKEQFERRKIEQELELAASIQSTLFPLRLPALAGFDIAARNRPARHCGGDYYDVLPVGASQPLADHLICVADVSGKGLPASLLMSNIQATLRALLGRIPTLTELAVHINELLYASTPSNKYATGVLLKVSPEFGDCHYVNAGHTPCLLLRADGKAEWINATGTPLGLIPGMPFDEQAFKLEPGDIVALFSDGVTEAQDIHEEEYGEERLADLLRHHAARSSTDLVDLILDDIDRFAGNAAQYDDITILILKRVQPA